MARAMRAPRVNSSYTDFVSLNAVHTTEYKRPGGTEQVLQKKKIFREVTCASLHVEWSRCFRRKDFFLLAQKNFGLSLFCISG